MNLFKIELYLYKNVIMKKLLFLFFISSYCSVNSQTNVIALKSHAGKSSEIHKETDNFGEPPWKMGVDTVEFVENGCIVEHGFLNHTNTIRSEVYDGRLTDRIKEYYAPYCVFIGFSEIPKTTMDTEEGSKQNGVSLFVGTILLLVLICCKNYKNLSKLIEASVKTRK